MSRLECVFGGLSAPGLHLFGVLREMIAASHGLTGVRTRPVLSLLFSRFASIRAKVDMSFTSAFSFVWVVQTFWGTLRRDFCKFNGCS